MGTAERSSAVTSGSWSLPGGQGLLAQKRGSEQISALFENGVMVPMRGSDAAQRASLSSQPRVTTVSELSSTTSAPARASRMPRFAVRVKPSLRALRSRVTCGSRARAQSGEVGPDRDFRRGVVDQQQAPVAAGMGEHAVHAAGEIAGGVVDRNDDVDRHALRRGA